jgi:hypothetical protein
MLIWQGLLIAIAGGFVWLLINRGASKVARGFIEALFWVLGRCLPGSARAAFFAEAREAARQKHKQLTGNSPGDLRPAIHSMLYASSVARHWPWLWIDYFRDIRVPGVGASGRLLPAVGGAARKVWIEDRLFNTIVVAGVVAVAVAVAVAGGAEAGGAGAVVVAFAFAGAVVVALAFAVTSARDYAVAGAVAVAVAYAVAVVVAVAFAGAGAAAFVFALAAVALLDDYRTRQKRRAR